MTRKAALAAGLAILAGPAAADAERGEYVLRMGGCVACHTQEDGAFLAGGRALETPFGTFYSPNITPDAETGIGGWSLEDFARALREGVAPGGGHYYPAFPYTSYTRMTDADVADLKAYLDTVDPVANAAPEHELDFPFGFRPLVRVWQWLFFEPGVYQPDPNQSELWNRGAYLVTGPEHCGECHSPRNLFGAIDEERALSGAESGPDGDPVPSIRPTEDGIGGWSESDIVFALQIGMLPDGDFLGGAMNEVVEDATSKLSEEDLRAIATYLLSLPPLPAE